MSMEVHQRQVSKGCVRAWVGDFSVPEAALEAAKTASGARARQQQWGKGGGGGVIVAGLAGLCSGIY